MTQKRLPMVSTGRGRSCAAAVVARSATRGLGMRRLTRGQATMIATVSSAITTAHGFREFRWAPGVRQRAKKAAGTGPILRPRKSLTSPERMIRGDAAREPDGDRVRDELDRGPEPREPK